MRTGLSCSLSMDFLRFFLLMSLNVFVYSQFPCDPARYSFGATGDLIDYAVDHADVAPARPTAIDNPTTTIMLTQEEGFIGKSKCCGMVDKWVGMYWSTANISLQVWRKVPLTAEEFMLVGEYEYTPTNTGKIEEEAHPDTDIYIRKNDLIGWTGNSLWKAEAVMNTRFAFGTSLKKEENLHPVVGTTYTINTIHPQLDVGARGYAIRMIPRTRAGPSCAIALNQIEVPDTLSIGSLVGSVTGHTPDTYGTVTLSLSTKATELSLNAANGEITTASNLTVSTPPRKLLTVKVLVDDDCATQGTCTATLTVAFTNRPIEIVSLPNSTTLIESTVTETTLHTVRTYDMNRNTVADSPRCSINSTVPANGPFTIRRGTPPTFTLILDANPGLNYDATNRHIVNVQCSDEYGSTDERPFTLYLTPNQPPVVNNSVNGEIVVMVNAKTTNGGDVVVQLEVIDVENDRLLLAFRKLNSYSPFEFQESLLQIYATKALRDEEDSLHGLVVTVGDTYNNPYPVNIFIHLSGINSRPIFNNCPQTLPILETANVGATLCQVGATDANYILDNQRHTFSLLSASPASFRSAFHIDTTSGSLTLNSVIDYENFRDQSNESYITVNITVTDGIHHAKEDCVLSFDIVDVNERPILKQRSYSYSFNESEAPLYFGSTQMDFTDVDINDHHYFRIVHGDPSEFFQIDKQTGSLSLIKSCDIEDDCPKYFDLIVEVVDRGGLVDTAAVKLNVLDVNDNPPTFPKVVYEVEVTNQTSVGTKLLMFNATDADEGVNSELTYSVVGIGLGAKYFDVTRAGVLILKKKIDYRDDVTFVMTVCSRDSGLPPLEGCVHVQVVYPKWTTLRMVTTTRPQPCFLCVEGGVVLFTIFAFIAFCLAMCILFWIRNFVHFPRIRLRLPDNFWVKKRLPSPRIRRKIRPMRPVRRQETPQELQQLPGWMTHLDHKVRLPDIQEEAPVTFSFWQSKDDYHSPIGSK